MAKTISKLSIQLSASSATLKNDLNQASGLVQGFAGKIKSFAVGIGAALAGAFTVGAAVNQVQAAMTRIDEVAKAADQLGTTVGQMQALSLAGDLAGVSTEQLGLAMRTSQRQISEAAAGSESAAEAFAQLGLSVDALRGMDSAQQFQTILTALKGVSDQTDRVNLAMQIFGRGGQGLLSLDVATLQDAAAQIEAMGGGLSRLDAAKVEQANDAITKLKTAVGVLWDQVAVALAPAVKDVAAALTEAAVAAAHFMSNPQNLAEAQKLFQELGSQITDVVKVLTWLIQKWDEVESSMTGSPIWAAIRAMSNPQGLANVAKDLMLQAAGLDEVRTAAAAAGDGFGDLGAKAAAGIGQAAAATAGLKLDLEAAQKAMDARPAELGTFAKIIAAMAMIEKAKTKAREVGWQAYEETRTPVEQILEKWQQLKNAEAMGEVGPQTMARASEKYKKDLAEALAEQEKIAELQGGGGPVSAVQRGTSAATSAIQSAQREYREMARRQQQQLEAQRRANELLEKISGNTAEPIKIEEVQL